MAQVSEISNVRLEVLDNPLLLARLMSSVGTGESERPMIPYDAARAIKNLIDDIKKIHVAGNNVQISNNKAIIDAAKRLGIAQPTCQEFLQILKMPHSWRGVLAFNGDRSSGRLPFTIVRKLAPRYESGKLSEDDLNLLMSVAVNQNATRDEIENIVVYKDKNETLPLSECVKHIMNLTPIVIRGFVTIADVDPALLKKASEVFGMSGDKTVQALLTKHLGGRTVKGVQIKHKSYVQIVFNDEEGSNKFYNMAEKYVIPPNSLVNHILSIELGDGV